MNIYYRTKIKIDQELLSEIIIGSVKACTTRSGYINRILFKMLGIIDEFDYNPNTKPPIDVANDFPCNLVINIKKEYYERLKYLHFRFGTFSIATVLRFFLRLYLIKARGVINDIILMVRKFNQNRIWSCLDIGCHMSLKTHGISRIIILSDKFTLKNLTGFT